MAYFDPETYESGADADYLGIAADVVQGLAPAPVPLPTPDDYSPRAARAERLVFNWLKATKGGSLSAKGGIPGATGSRTFASLPVVQGLVLSATGSYYAGTTKGRIRSVPLARG